MTAILRRLPFSSNEDEVAVGPERIRIRPEQIIIWVSLSDERMLELPPHAPRFPVILDTGHNHNFSLLQSHLTRWARVDLTTLRPRRAIRVWGQRARLYPLSVWLHPNEPGMRDRLADRPPFRMDFVEGIAVHSDASMFPPVPLLGLRALVQSHLHLSIDPERRWVNLRTPDWRTRLLRWLG